MVDSFKVWYFLSIDTFNSDAPCILHVLEVIVLLNIVEALMSHPNVFQLLQLFYFDRHVEQTFEFVQIILLLNSFFVHGQFLVENVGVTWFSRL